MVNLDKLEGYLAKITSAMRFNKFTTRHYENLSAIFRDMAQVAAAGIVLPFFIDVSHPVLAFFGVALVVALLFLSFKATDRTTYDQ